VINEVHRQAYLQAMGVASYMPRLQLPGALASRLCELPVRVELPPEEAAVSAAPVIEAGAAAQSPVQQRHGASSSSVAALQALLDDKKPAATTRRAVTSKPVAIEGNAAQANTAIGDQLVPQFSLTVIRGQNLLIIDEGLAGHINPNEYLQLLQNMLFAVGAGKQSLSIGGFSWPMAKNSPLDQTELAARQTLQSFLGKLSEQIQARYWLLMGDTSARYVAEPDLAKGSLVAHPSLSLQMLCTESAGQMLAEPMLKAQVWQQLQVLSQLLRQAPEA
jgi:hypothetical protein